MSIFKLYTGKYTCYTYVDNSVSDIEKVVSEWA
jgi:hypothetical protein